MITKVTHVTIWVKDQDAALKFYRDQLGFKVISDDSTTIPNYRWLTVAPQPPAEPVIALNLATTPEQLAGIGKQGLFVLESTDIHADYATLKTRNVKIQTEPRENPWGSDFIFEDLYGNDFNVVQSPAS
jgi:catechol 2,3-dioxygenase-like lactoylglutathione lyase family enzyme